MPGMLHHYQITFVYMGQILRKQLAWKSPTQRYLTDVSKKKTELLNVDLSCVPKISLYFEFLIFGFFGQKMGFYCSNTTGIFSHQRELSVF